MGDMADWAEQQAMEQEFEAQHQFENDIWNSANGEIHISNMSEDHIHACINAITDGKIYLAGLENEWLKKFKRELKTRETRKNTVNLTEVEKKALKYNELLPASLRQSVSEINDLIDEAVTNLKENVAVTGFTESEVKRLENIYDLKGYTTAITLSEEDRYGLVISGWADYATYLTAIQKINK